MGKVTGLHALCVCAMSLGALVGGAQGLKPADAGPRVLLSSGSVSGAASNADSEIVREIDDPQLGVRWLLMHDRKNAGGPGLLVPATSRSKFSGTSTVLQAAYPDHQAPILRGGDRVVVEEHTRIADACLEGVALGPARAGATLAVRLRTGGAIVSAVALGPGRAELALHAEARR